MPFRRPESLAKKELNSAILAGLSTAPTTPLMQEWVGGAKNNPLLANLYDQMIEILCYYY
jgi:hypothetical protein